ncbi:hypothetical protein ACU4GA_12680 [Methylobacterium oryzae CBMB20]
MRLLHARRPQLLGDVCSRRRDVLLIGGPELRSGCRERLGILQRGHEIVRRAQPLSFSQATQYGVEFRRAGGRLLPSLPDFTYGPSLHADDDRAHPIRVGLRGRAGLSTALDHPVFEGAPHLVCPRRHRHAERRLRLETRRAAAPPRPDGRLAEAVAGQRLECEGGIRLAMPQLPAQLRGHRLPSRFT